MRSSPGFSGVAPSCVIPKQNEEQRFPAAPNCPRGMLRAWYHDARKADWRSPADIKRVYANASIVAENRVVFNIKGNKYRLVVAINYSYRMCYVRFVGSHQTYDRIDVKSV